MPLLVGASYMPPTKQHVLLFDRIVSPWAFLIMDVAADEGESCYPNVMRLAADFEWLRRRKILLEPPAPRSEARYKKIESRIREFNKLSEYSISVALRRKRQDTRRRLAMKRSADTLSRLYADYLRKERHLNVVPILSAWQPMPTRATTRTDVVQVVLKDLPLPKSNHGYRELLDFRAAAREHGLVQSLRVWINEMSTGKLSTVEVSDKLEDLVSRYERALKLERFTRDSGSLEMIVTAVAEAAENLVKFRWSRLASSLFSVRHRKVALMKAEMTLPGREVAYISKAREGFGR